MSKENALMILNYYKKLLVPQFYYRIQDMQVLNITHFTYVKVN